MSTELYKFAPTKGLFASLKGALEDDLIISKKSPLVTIVFKKYSSAKNNITLLCFTSEEADNEHDSHYLLLNDSFVPYKGDSFEQTLMSSFSLEEFKKTLTFKGVLCEDERCSYLDSDLKSFSSFSSSSSFAPPPFTSSFSVSTSSIKLPSTNSSNQNKKNNTNYVLLGHLSHADTVESVIYSSSSSGTTGLPMLDVNRVLNYSTKTTTTTTKPFLKNNDSKDCHGAKDRILDLLCRSI